MKASFISFIVVFLVVNNSMAQELNVSSLESENERFLLEVKQLDQFIKRFNNQENILKGYEKSSAEILKEKKDTITFQTERKKAILSLFDLSDSTLICNKDIIDFINFTGDDSNHIQLDYEDADWFAFVDCTVFYKGKKQNVTLVLKNEGSNTDGFKWIINSIHADFINLSPVKNDSTKFISPMNNELGFMDLYKIFNDNENISVYTYKNFQPDALSVFLYLVKAKEIQYEKVIKIQYHFLQIKNWVFTVDYFNRGGSNSGWLISSIKRVNDSDKRNYKKSILNLNP